MFSPLKYAESEQSYIKIHQQIRKSVFSLPRPGGAGGEKGVTGVEINCPQFCELFRSYITHIDCYIGNQRDFKPRLGTSTRWQVQVQVFDRGEIWWQVQVQVSWQKWWQVQVQVQVSRGNLMASTNASTSIAAMLIYLMLKAHRVAP